MKHTKATDLQNQRPGSVALTVSDFTLVFICLLMIYSLTFSGSFRIDDEHILVARAQSLAFWDHINYPQIYGNNRVRHLSTISERIASPVVAIEPGQTVLGSILYQFASGFEIGGVQSIFTLNLYATALTGALVYLASYFLGYRRKVALLSAFVYGLATMAWPYSKTAFRDPLATIMITVAILGWTILIKRNERKRIAGLLIYLVGMLGALFFKSNVLVLLPSFLITACYLAYQPRQSPRLDKSWIIIGFLPLILLGIVTLCVSNPGPLSRFSISYYMISIKRYWENLNIQTLTATLGPFFSPAKSIFLFNPVFFLIPWIVIRAWKKIKHIALPFILYAVLLAIFQALHLREHWAGTLIWGLRNMLSILPMFSLLLAPWLEWLVSDGYEWKKSLSWFLIAISALIQLSGAIVAWYIPFTTWYTKGLDPNAVESLWQFKFLVIPYHLQDLLQISSWDIAWVRTYTNQRWVLLIPILAFIFLGIALFFLRKGKITIRPFWYRFVPGFLIVFIAISFPIYPSLWLLRGDPSLGGAKPELQLVIDWAEEKVKEGDLVVVDSYGTDLWQRMMNNWDEPIPWYSLPYEIPGTEAVGSEVGGEPSEVALDLFQRLDEDYSRLIYLTSQETPDYGLRREEGWLKANLSLLEDVEYKGSTMVKGSIFLP